MTEYEFHKKIHPLIQDRLDEFRQDGEKAVEESLTVCFLKELDFRLENDDESNTEDGKPWLDEVDPNWFVDEVLSVVEDWAGAPEMLCCGDTGFEAYRDFMKIMKQNWEEHKNGEDDEKDPE